MLGRHCQRVVRTNSKAHSTATRSFISPSGFAQTPPEFRSRSACVRAHRRKCLVATFTFAVAAGWVSPRRRGFTLAALLSVAPWGQGVLAQEAQPAEAQHAALNIKQLSLEDLMEINVYSASRRLERVQGIPNAVFVLTAEDIRRSRVTNIPDALRLVPGVQVAQTDNNKIGVSIRGFIGGFGGSSAARLANKLLVLVDGRSIYDPLFSGVFWESRDIVLADVERIEVIRGPGGALWGANAVNGVINIITRHARDTQDAAITAGAGSVERAFGTVRYGWQAGPEQYARVYAKTFERDTGFSPSGNPYDATRSRRAGFRWDWGPNARDTLRLSGDVYAVDAGQRNAVSATNPVTSTQDAEHGGGNLLAHWRRKLSATDSLRAQFYYDRTELDTSTVDQDRDTYDFELQHSTSPLTDHQVVWGLGYRNTRDNINGIVTPSRRTDETLSGFIQDTIALTPDMLHLTLGTKFEHNDYTKQEWQPSVRLAWTPSEREAWWAALSRAVRVPSRLEADLVINGNNLGGQVQSETVYAYELGYRQLTARHVWWDAAMFYNQYRDLVTIETGTQLRNNMRGDTYGLELGARWQVRPTWRLDLAYTYLEMDLAVSDASVDISRPVTTEKSNPRNQVTLRSALDIAPKLQFDAIVRAVDELPALDVPQYVTLDLGLSWFPKPDLELALVGRNLLDDHHPEQLVVADGSGTEVRRNYYAKLSWRF